MAFGSNEMGRMIRIAYQIFDDSSHVSQNYFSMF